MNETNTAGNAAGGNAMQAPTGEAMHNDRQPGNTDNSPFTSRETGHRDAGNEPDENGAESVPVPHGDPPRIGPSRAANAGSEPAINQGAAAGTDTPDATGADTAPGDEEESEELRQFGTQEQDLARRFARMYRGRVLYDHTFGEWRIYDGVLWKRDTCEEIMALAQRMTDVIFQEAIHNGSKQALREAARARSYSALTNIIRCARSLTVMRTTADAWDPDPLLFNVTNGTIDLRTCTLRPHDPNDRITMVAGCAYDPNASAEYFLMCGARWFPEEDDPRQEVFTFLLDVLGYSLSGEAKEKHFYLLHGTGDTGKTTLMNAVRSTWGDYFATTEWNTLARQQDTNGNTPRADLARLRGKRIVWASEGDEGCRMSDGLIKRITGRGSLVVRELYGKSFDLEPSMKIYLDTNHAPKFRGHDQAIWNRVKRVAFKQVITVEEQHAFRDRYGDLDRLLQAEASGILNLALAGWKRYQANGKIIVPAVVAEATIEYRKSEDLVLQFIDERCAKGDRTLVVTKKLFHEQFTEYCREMGEETKSRNWLGRWMKDSGYTDTKDREGHKWLGITVKTYALAPEPGTGATGTGTPGTGAHPAPPANGTMNASPNGLFRHSPDTASAGQSSDDEVPF